MMRIIRCLFITIVVAAIALTAFVWSGMYNVGASDPHWKTITWLLGQTKDRSIVAQSANITVPPLKDAGTEKKGFAHYHALCRFCHGAPGYLQHEFAQGLYPPAPDLATGEMQKKWNEAQLYWIIKNGLKFSGMPSFGLTHNEEQLWQLVAFVKRLPSVSVEVYAQWAKPSEGNGEGEGAAHDH
jgi:mono/diheme cytochrome c family protein